MRKLILSELSAVIFFEPEESFLLKGIERGACNSENAIRLLDCAGINLPSENLYLELFEHDGKNVLFVTASENADESCVIYRFNCADNLMDAVRSLPVAVLAADKSSLYEMNGAYFLVIYPPYSIKTKCLLEFAQAVKNKPVFCSYLLEHGSLLSSPCALREMSKHFRIT